MSEIPPGPGQSDFPAASDFVNYAGALDPKDKLNWAGITALVLGCCNVMCWIVPLCGCPTGIAGIVFGIIGLKSNKRGFALAGLIMSSISMVLTIINAIVGVYLQQKGMGIWRP